MPVKTEEIAGEIERLRTERKAVILAHNYQRGEVQDIADYVGDSLGLARQAAGTDAEVIVFCGVHFMAETAAILSPNKTVLIPDLNCDCSLSAMISADSLRRWKAEHPGAVVVAYVNCSAEVKAESDYCCTSSNAIKVVQAIPEDKEILFVPDQFLGHYCQIITKRKIHIWPGYCHAHNNIRTDDIKALQDRHPKAEFVMHPECGCLTHCMLLADKVVSTEGIRRYCGQSPKNEFIIGTEVGIIHRLRKENPEKTFYSLTDDAFCEFMKLTTLDKVLLSLQDLEHKVTVPPEIAARAKRAIDRMLEIT
jgi:quinolinate synthase